MKHLLRCGRFGIRGLLPYCTAKGGLEALTRALAQELAPKIRVNAIAPGFVHDQGPAIIVSTSFPGLRKADGEDAATSRRRRR